MFVKVQSLDPISNAHDYRRTHNTYVRIASNAHDYRRTHNTYVRIASNAHDHRRTHNTYVRIGAILPPCWMLHGRYLLCN